MKILTLFVLLLTIGCQKEEAPKNAVPLTGSSQAVSQSNDIDFDKKKDESCDTEEDLERQIEEAKKKEPTAFKLQGGDTGCSTH